MVRAVASLGVDRGIDGFARFTLAERFGRNTLAVGVGRVQVRERPEVSLLGQLDPWVERVRRGTDPPAGIRSAVRRIDAAMFEVARRGGAERLQDVLNALADAEEVVSRATTFRDRTRVGPVSGLWAADWVPRLDDGTPAFRVALGLASGRDRDGMCLRLILRPIRQAPGAFRADWTDGPELVPGLGRRPVIEVLASAHVRRVLMPASPMGSAPSDEDAGPGVQTAFQRAVPARLSDVSAFVAGDLDDVRLGKLLSALMLLDGWSKSDLSAAPGGNGDLIPARPADPAWAVLAPFFHGRRIQVGGDVPLLLRPEARWPIQLVAGQTESVLAAAIRRLGIARLDPAVTDSVALAALAPSGARLAAALLVPLSTRSVRELLTRVAPAPLEKEVRR
jgi:CRISPR-associated protein Csx17